MDLNFKATELSLALPGTEDLPDNNTTTTSPNPIIKTTNKRPSPDMTPTETDESRAAPQPKAQVVGWPPVRSYRKNVLHGKKAEAETGSGMFVKVSMDGAPYLRKIDLKVYKSYGELMKSLEGMFACIIGLYSENEGYNGSKHAATYEDKDGDWMLVGDVPWDMFVTSCKRLRIMKGCEARGLNL
ncbi:auxin-induced protein 22D-like [Bidens hawaiensis]|uniref:auxin-induced protein 22D-like n=1 Tax=Bidens hawaiensis TaxID=980011 RepID=UPI00404A95D7